LGYKQGELNMEIAEKHLTTTWVGNVITNTLLELSTIKGRNEDGTESDTRKVTGAIAFNAIKNSWEFLWKKNGDWDGIDCESLNDIHTIGALLGGVPEIKRLQCGVSALQRWKSELEFIARPSVSEEEGSMYGLVRYLQERIDAAEQEMARLIGE
jgi:muconolactone delta-isomerase